MKRTNGAPDTTRTARVKLLLVAIALVAAVIIGMALGDPTSVQETSEAALSWAMGYFGWSWL